MKCEAVVQITSHDPTLRPCDISVEVFTSVWTFEHDRELPGTYLRSVCCSPLAKYYHCVLCLQARLHRVESICHAVDSSFSIVLAAALSWSIR